jgi:hypothetical protein
VPELTVHGLPNTCAQFNIIAELATQGNPLQGIAVDFAQDSRTIQADKMPDSKNTPFQLLVAALSQLLAFEIHLDTHPNSVRTNQPIRFPTLEDASRRPPHLPQDCPALSDQRTDHTVHPVRTDIASLVSMNLT